jgi:hypothetical protein
MLDLLGHDLGLTLDPTTIRVPSGERVEVDGVDIGRTVLVECWTLLRARLPRFLTIWGLLGYFVFLAGSALEVGVRLQPPNPSRRPGHSARLFCRKVTLPLS